VGPSSLGEGSAAVQFVFAPGCLSANVLAWTNYRPPTFWIERQIGADPEDVVVWEMADVAKLDALLKTFEAGGVPFPPTRSFVTEEARAKMKTRPSDSSPYRTPGARPTTDNGAIATADPTEPPSDNSAATPPPGRTLAGMLQDYSFRLERAPLSEHTRRAYRGHVGRFLSWLGSTGSAGTELWDPHARDFAVRDYRRSLKDGKLAASSVNAALASVDHFCRTLGVGSPQVDRDRLPGQAPRALSEAELRSVVRAAIRAERPRDTAAIALMAFAGLRVAETVGLDVEDVAISARKGSVTVRRGKGDSGRTVPLSTEARALIEPWVHRSPRETSGPLFAGPAGHLSARAVDRLTRRIGASAGMSLSPHVLRHTFVTRLVRSGVDVVLVAELAGHRSLETTRRYALPTQEDRAAAVEALAVDP
jgi:site-specific recombinase XerD